MKNYGMPLGVSVYIARFFAHHNFAVVNFEKLKLQARFAQEA